MQAEVAGGLVKSAKERTTDGKEKLSSGQVQYITSSRPPDPSEQMILCKKLQVAHRLGWPTK